MKQVFLELGEKGIKLTVDEQGKLLVRGKIKFLTEEEKNFLKNNKSEIISTIKNNLVVVPDKQSQVIPERLGLNSGVLSFSQRRLWFIDKLQQDSSEYNIPIAFNVKGHLNITLVEKTLNDVIKRHQILRTIYQDYQGEPLQKVLTDIQLTIDYKDFCDIESQYETVQAYLCEEAIRAFDLSQDLMIRASYVALDNKEVSSNGILTFNVHHIAADGWSMDVLTREFFVIYQAFEQGLSSPLIDLPIQYLDFAHWQQNEFKQHRLQYQLDYWQRQLHEAPVLHQLSLDNDRPAEKQYKGDLVSTVLDENIAEKLLQFAKLCQLTPFMLLHAALTLVLSRHSGSDDIIIGSPVANRREATLEPLIGFFVNTLVFRVNTGHTHLLTYFKHLRQVHLEAQDNQDVPFEQLVEALNVPRNNAHSPLFQILLTTNNQFVAHKDEKQQLKLGNAYLQPMSEVNLTTKFDLDIHMALNSDGASTAWTYDVSLFNKAHIEQLNQHLLSVLVSFADMADFASEKLQKVPISAVRMFSSEENNLAAKIAIGPQLPLNFTSMHGMFEHQVMINPQKVALKKNDIEFTFQTLNERADTIADILIANYGVTKGQPIGLYGERSQSTICAVLAILKAGAVYVALDRTAPADRLSYIVDELNLALILCNSSADCPGNSISLAVMGLDILENENINHINVKRPEITIADAAYILYTSGSTGRPKGVCQKHGTLVNLARHQAEIDGITQAYNTLQFTPLTFDVSAQELATSWLTGSCLTLISQQQKDQLEYLAELLYQQNIERLFVPPAVLDLITEHVNTTGNGLPCLKEVFVAGDVFKMTKNIQQFLITHQQCKLYNHYGPTETHVASTYRVLVEDSGDISIGRSIANTCCYVLSSGLTPVPLGCVGELYIAGQGVALGYVNNQKLTNESFIYSELYDEVLYKTGDLVRYNSDGRLNFIGRVDNQVKIRGFRIELGEVVHAIEALENVDSVIVEVNEVTGNKQLVAYVRPCLTCETEAKEHALIETIKVTLKDSLPGYMIPSVFAVIAEWPLTSNGKLDKSALPPVVSIQSNRNLVAPDTDTEWQLAKIWSRLLNIELPQLSTTDDFFEMGGHSLLSVRLVSEIREQLSVEVTVKQIFSSSTIKQLAYLIGCSSKVVKPQILSQSREQNEFDLSFAQQRLWFIDQFQGGSPQYNMPMAFQIEGSFDLISAEQVLTAIVRRHEVLRTVYRESESGPKQCILPAQPFIIQRLDFGHLAQQSQSLVKQQLLEDAQTPFDLSADLMLRASYISLSETRGVLMLNMHHIASDGWSLNQLKREFFILYHAFIEGKPSPLNELSIQYADFSQWQRNWLQGTVLQQQLDYWQTQLNSVPSVHSVPLDFPRPAEKQYSGAMVMSRVPLQEAQQLCKMATDYQMTPFMLLHAALALTISRYSNTFDIVIGTPVANRMQVEVEPLIGFFVNILALRVDTEQASFDTYLTHVRETHLDAQSHQDLPFEQLVDALQVPRSEALAPLCQLMASFTGQLDKQDCTIPILPNLQLTPLLADACIAKFDIEVEFSLLEGGLQINWIYDQSLFTHSHIEELSQHLNLLVERLGQGDIAHINKQTPIELNVVPNELSDYLVKALNNNACEYERALCIHELFEQQVHLAPEQIALVYQQQQLSYKQLNCKANQLAHYLLDHSTVKSDILIGICLDRSLEMIIATLAVLKAGGAYVPLDPSYPKARLDYMLKDSGITTIITKISITNEIDLVGYQAINIDELFSPKDVLFTQYSDENIAVTQLELSSTDLAYEIYTSGSTGKPKGVLLEHRGIVNLAKNQRVAFNIEPSCKVLHFASMSFDAGTWEYAMALLNGATLVITDKDQRISPEAIGNLLYDAKITHVTLPPAFLAMMNFRSDLALQGLIVAGEACDPELVDLWSEKYPFYNAYGPTEASVCCSYQRLYPGMKITIGKPLHNVSLYVLDKYLELVPPGVIGELHIGGDGLARGYHQRPEMTAEKFIINPYYNLTGHRDSELIYKTGDLAKILPDGNIEFVGRIDAQVKIRGFRIELSEIEAQLSQCNELDSALVVVKEAKNGTKFLVAYINPKDISQSLSLAELTFAVQTQLSVNLPDYMVPTSFIKIDSWPLTANGKVDKKALPELVGDSAQLVYIKPETVTEQTMVDLWSELLGIAPEEIGCNAKFFEMGGNSILITRLETLIRNQFSVEFSIKELFAITVLKDQSLHIDYLLSRLSYQATDNEEGFEETDW